MRRDPCRPSAAGRLELVLLGPGKAIWGASVLSASRFRRGMIQLAWRFLIFQKNSTLAQWFRARTENARGTRKLMIVALARKLLIALWRLVREGVVPDGVVLRPTQ
jgi:hypothetical protein